MARVHCRESRCHVHSPYHRQASCRFSRKIPGPLSSDSQVQLVYLLYGAYTTDSRSVPEWRASPRNFYMGLRCLHYSGLKLFLQHALVCRHPDTIQSGPYLGRSLKFPRSAVFPQDVVSCAKKYTAGVEEGCSYKTIFLLILSSLMWETGSSGELQQSWLFPAYGTQEHTGGARDNDEGLHRGSSGYDSAYLPLRSLSRKRGKRRDDDRPTPEPYRDTSENGHRMLPLRLIVCGADTYEMLLAEYQEDQRWQNEQRMREESTSVRKRPTYARSISSFDDLLLRPPLPPDEDILLGGERNFELVEAEVLNMDNYQPKQFYKTPNNPWRETQRYEKSQRRQALMSSLDEEALELIKSGAQTLAASVEGDSGSKSKIASALSTLAQEADMLARERGNYSSYINIRTGLPCIPSPAHVFCVVRPTSTSTTAPPTFLDLLRYKRQKEEEEERQRKVRSFLLQEELRKSSYLDPYDRPVIYSECGEDAYEPVPASSSLSRFKQELLRKKRDSYGRSQENDLKGTNEETVNILAQFVKRSESDETRRNQTYQGKDPAQDASQESRDMLLAAVKQQHTYQEVSPLKGVSMSAELSRRAVKRNLATYCNGRAAFSRHLASMQMEKDSGALSTVEIKRENVGTGKEEDEEFEAGRQSGSKRTDLYRGVDLARLAASGEVLLSVETDTSADVEYNNDLLSQQGRQFQQWVTSALYLPEELAPFQRGAHSSLTNDMREKSSLLRLKQKKQERQKERLSRLIEGFAAGTYADELLATASANGEVLQQAEALTGPLLRKTAMPPILARRVQLLQNRRHFRESNAERRREKRWEMGELAREAASLNRLEETLMSDTYAFLSGFMEGAQKGVK